MSKSKKILGLGVLCVAISTQAMQPEQPSCAVQSQNHEPELPQPDLSQSDQYARIFSEQNRRFLAESGYTQQDIEEFIAAERLRESQRMQQLLLFYEHEKVCPVDPAVQDSESRKGLQGAQKLSKDVEKIVQREHAELQSLKKWDRCKLVTIPITLLITFPIAIWLAVAVFSCKPHAS